MDDNEELPEIKQKLINGVEISNVEISKIAMVCDYLVLDHFQEVSSFLRLEKCFGPFFIKENSDFLPNVFQELCGPKRKYLNFGRLITAYTKWKSKSSTNENFNKFMDTVFGMIKTQNEVIGKLVEGGRIFSTRNTRGRKVISRFSVLTDETKNQLNGFHIQYDDFFDTVLSPKKTRDDITLEMNFAPNGRNIRDRDGISHIGGKYSKTKEIIKFLIFKCRSGKTFYIGDPSEEDGEQFELFLFGTSSCQLKSIRVELINGQLVYLEPKFQASLRVNQKILDFDSIDNKYIEENITNNSPIFEEIEMQNIPMEQLIETNSLLIPCVSDDAFIDKKTLYEPLSGKDFNEIYKTFLVAQSEEMEKEKEEIRQKIYEKTIMRKHLLKIFFNKFKIRENIEVLKNKKQPETRIDMDKFLCKVKGYRKRLNKKIQKMKEEEEKNKEDEEEEIFGDNEEDWAGDKKVENSEYEDEVRPKELQGEENKEIINENIIKIENEPPKEEENNPPINENIENNNNIKIENEPPKEEENIIEVQMEAPVKEEEGENNNIEIKQPNVVENHVEVDDNNNTNVNDEQPKPQPEKLNIEVQNEEKIVIDGINQPLQEDPQGDEIKIKKGTKKLLRKAKKSEEPNAEEIKQEEPQIEIKLDIPKVEEEEVKMEEEIKQEEPKIEENQPEVPKVEEEKPKNEEIKLEVNQIEEIKNEEPKIEEVKLEAPKVVEEEQPKKEEINQEVPQIQEIQMEEPKIEEIKKEEPIIEEVKKEEPKKEEVKKKEIEIEEVKIAEDNSNNNNKILDIVNRNDSKITNEVNNKQNEEKSEPKKKKFCFCF